MGSREQPVRYQTELEDSARWDGFAFRPGDIVISAPSKSGTTWAQMICALLVFQTPRLPAPLTTLSPWLDMRIRPAADVHTALAAQRHRRFIKTHTPLDGIPADDRVHYVAVGRDPRDLAASLRHQARNLRRDVLARLVDDAEPGNRYEPKSGSTGGDRDTFLRWLNSDDHPVGNLDTLRGLVWQQTRAWSRRRKTNVVLVHYRDLSTDLDAEMRRLARALRFDVPERIWPTLVTAATFARMQSRAAELVPDEQAGIFLDPAAFFRRGTTGDWRTWLTDDDQASYAARLAGLGAPPELVRWLHHGREGAARP